jgi:hypothetical protein
MIHKQKIKSSKECLLSIDANRMQKSSSFNSPSAKSLACQTQDFSFPACSCTVILGKTKQNKQPTKNRLKFKKSKSRKAKQNQNNTHCDD